MAETSPRPSRPLTRKTRTSVRVAEAVSRTLITIGGVGTILAVVLVFVFLVSVVVPLFFPADVKSSTRAIVDEPWESPLHLEVDDYQTMAWALYPDGRLSVYRIATGEVLKESQLFEDGTITALSSVVGSNLLGVGFEDGTVRLGEIAFKVRFLDPQSETESLGELEVGESVRLAEGLVTKTPAGQLRVQEVAAEFRDPISAGDHAVGLLAHAESPSGPVFTTWDTSGALRLHKIREKRNMLTGKTTSEVRSLELEYEAPVESDPAHLHLASLGSSVVLAWPGGKAVEFATHNFTAPEEYRTFDFVEAEGGRINEIASILGSTTLVVASSTGVIGTWFPVRDETAEGEDPRLVMARTLPSPESEVVALAPSKRGRALAMAQANGTVDLVHVTSNKLLATLDFEAPGAERDGKMAMAFAPKDDGLVALTPAGLWNWTFDLRHPEASLKALFRPVWYEGYPEPAYVWQSSSGTDDFEPKLSLVPLIFGTLKATFYSALFGIPLALLAAVGTSEFMPRRWRSPVKTTIELMAALPSVVLGFLAALVFAPYVETWLPGILASFFMIPLATLLGACLWQLLPRGLYLRLARFRPVPVFLAMVAGGVGGFYAGPVMEDVLFAENIRLWLDGSRGTAFGGWILLFTPLAALCVGAVVGLRVRPRVAQIFAQSSRLVLGLADLVILTVSLILVALVVGGVAYFLMRLGLDPRGGVLGTYVQRNALVVGFVMGFAIIPIIYTIAEDAFSSVPDHLRSASLAAGATQWQTVSRIVLPTAMSGVFSAIMIGLGRAVGETMIVLMAAGNTPILEWNIFNGFRTLSANLAVELPEAVRGSTHYRTLFLAALVLFFMTFIVNSLAEVVRRRFQKRSYQL